jgi:superfamily I DNA/RNA helicase
MVHPEDWDADEKVREERRLFYVALTRAKKRLVAVHAREMSKWGEGNR